MFAKSAVIAFFAALSAAQLHEPVGDVPEGNPITRPLNEIVEAGTPFTITWTPTSPANTVSLLFLKGPSNNVVPVETIAEGIPNTGSYTWTPSAAYGESAEGATTGFGIQLIDDVTGKYQYSTQFGVDIPADYKPETSSSEGYPTATPTPSSTSEDGYPTSKANSTSAYPTVTKHTSSYVASTGYPVSNSSIVLPSKSMTVPSSLKTSATATAGPSGTQTTSPPESTGAASQLRVGAGVVAGVAAMFFML